MTTAARASTIAGAAPAPGQRSSLLSLLAMIVGAAALGLFWSSNFVLAQEVTRRQARATQLAHDAEVILRLRTRPQLASETSLPQRDILERLNKAMSAAHLPADALMSVLPQPARRGADPRYTEVAHRLIFENVELRPLVAAGRALVNDNPMLRIDGIQLRAHPKPQRWNAELTVTQRVFVSEQPRRDKSIE